MATRATKASATAPSSAPPTRTPCWNFSRPSERAAMEATQEYAWQQRSVRWLVVLLALGALGAYFGWHQFLREEPHPDRVTATPEMRFKYRSIGAEYDAGLPFWIFYVMPRVFANKLPRPGGLASLGVAWEQGQELPVGFTKKVIGFPRVA